MPAQITIKSLADINRLAGLIDARVKFLSDALSKSDALRDTEFTPSERQEFRKEYKELERLRQEF